MDTSHAPQPAPLPDDVQQRIHDYTPRAISPADWDRCRASVITLVTAAPPANADDAADLLSSSVALIDYAAPKAGTWQLGELLAGPWLVRFAADWRRAQRPDNTLRNHLGALHRLQRTAAGGDGSRRIRRTDRDPPRTSRPYGAVELEALRAASEFAPEGVGAAIHLALDLADQGITAPHAHLHGLTEDAWHAAQRWVRDHRLPPLDRLELQRMWVLEVAATASLADALHRGLSRDQLDGVRMHLEAGDPDTVRSQLRDF